jgi:hypothetical protein
MPSKSSNHQNDVIDVGDSRDWRGIELEFILIDDAMVVMGMKLTMNTMNECSECELRNAMVIFLVFKPPMTIFNSLTLTSYHGSGQRRSLVSGDNPFSASSTFSASNAALNSSSYSRGFSAGSKLRSASAPLPQFQSWNCFGSEASHLVHGIKVQGFKARITSEYSTIALAVVKGVYSTSGGDP